MCTVKSTKTWQRRVTDHKHSTLSTIDRVKTSLLYWFTLVLIRNFRFLIKIAILIINLVTYFFTENRVHKRHLNICFAVLKITAFAIRWPFRHRVASSSIYSFYIISIITVWIIGLGLMTLFLLETYTNKVGALTSTLIINGTKFISLYLISVTYLKIRKRLRDTNPAVALEAHNRKTVEENVRLSTTIFLVTGLLFGLWLPV